MRLTARGLNKPRLVFGLDQKLLGIGVILFVIVGANGSKIAGFVLFLVLCVVGRRMSKKDPNYIEVFKLAYKQKAIYEPLKGEHV